MAQFSILCDTIVRGFRDTHETIASKAGAHIGFMPIMSFRVHREYEIDVAPNVVFAALKLIKYDIHSVLIGGICRKIYKAVY